MRILVTGSREWDDETTMRQAFGRLISQVGPENVTIVEGGAWGADNQAASIAQRWGGGLTLETHPADWRLHGKAAGFIRNQEMVDAGADICLAFKQVGAGNRGTEDCIHRAIKAGIPVHVYWSNGDLEFG